MEFRILGPLEALDGGRPIAIPGAKERALLTLLLLRADQTVPFERIVDELWGTEPPETARKSLQVRVSGLRKALGADVVVTRGRGYSVLLGDSTLDLRSFERGLERGRRALEAERYGEAAAALREALSLWRGLPLQDFAYETFAQAAIHRLEELRLVALELRIEADLALGREHDLVPELEQLVAEQPLREHLYAQLMLALYRSGRQADALAAYHEARRALVDELGIEPGTRLRELEHAILRQDAELLPSVARPADRLILVGASGRGSIEPLLSVAEPLSRRPPRELIVTRSVSEAAELPLAATAVEEERLALQSRGVVARAAALVTADGSGLVRLAREQDVDLLLVAAPSAIFEDEMLRVVLDEAPCDVGILVGEAPGDDGPVVVPFAGAEHDWAALEVAAWFAQAVAAPLRLAGPNDAGKDSSRLLASASLAVQRAVGVSAEPQLVEPDPVRLLEASRDARIVVVGLTSRWRAEGLGAAREALASRVRPPTLVVRRGGRPGGLASPAGVTRFTWTIAPAGT